MLCPVLTCSGVIVSEWNVLTTAACVNYLLPEDVKVYVGSNKLKKNGFTFSVANILIHPDYSRQTNDCNIAILTLSEPFDYSVDTVDFIPIAAEMPSVGSNGVTSGFGAIDPNLQYPETLQAAVLRIYSQNQCERLKNIRLKPSMFCAGDTAGKRDLCPDDQGAPIQHQGELIGISSFGYSCGLAAPNPSTPVFTSVVYLSDWILQNIFGFDDYENPYGYY